MKKLLLSALTIGALFANNTNEELLKQIEALKAKINQLEKQVKENKKAAEENKKIALNAQKKANPFAANDHLYWSLDLRSSFDYLEYKLTSGKKLTNNVFSNRVILKGLYKPADNLKVNVAIEANTIAGMNNNNAYDNISWTANETPDDTNIRVKEAYFAYWFGKDNGYMFSAGRRPATEGYPANLREGDNPESPIAHLVNIEFDGISFTVTNTAMSDWSDKFSDWGSWFKFCAGRGYSSSTGKFSTYPYSKDNNKINDFAGFIIVPYDDGQYALWTETIKAWNVKGFKDKDNNGTIDPSEMNLVDLGDYFGFDVLFKASGIGDGISDFLDNTNAFISFALSKTEPNSNGELGTTDSKTGTSIWIGADMPANEDGDDRFGFNFVHGSKYWRSITYGEDTLIGSIAATRGNAYEAYYIKQIIPHLTASLRATYIKYDYTGSNGFFGDGGKPVNVDDDPNAIKHAMDIRAYIRYKF